MEASDFIFGSILVGFIVLLTIGITYDVQRLGRVEEAQTQEEISKACDEYDTSSMKNVPAKCLKHFNAR